MPPSQTPSDDQLYALVGLPPELLHRICFFVTDTRSLNELLFVNRLISRGTVQYLYQDPFSEVGESSSARVLLSKTLFRSIAFECCYYQYETFLKAVEVGFQEGLGADAESSLLAGVMKASSRLKRIYTVIDDEFRFPRNVVPMGQLTALKIKYESLGMHAQKGLENFLQAIVRTQTSRLSLELDAHFVSEFFGNDMDTLLERPPNIIHKITISTSRTAAYAQLANNWHLPNLMANHGNSLKTLELLNHNGPWQWLNLRPSVTIFQTWNPLSARVSGTSVTYDETNLLDRKEDLGAHVSMSRIACLCARRKRLIGGALVVFRSKRRWLRSHVFWLRYCNTILEFWEPRTSSTRNSRELPVN